MRTKIKIAFAVLTSVMLLGLAAVHAQTADKLTLLLAVPRLDASVSVTAAEAVNDRPVLARLDNGVAAVGESRVMLTYELRREAAVNALRARHDAVLVGTNHTYPFVMRFPLVNGAFFGRDAVAEAHRTAVLNERAAFDLFGATAAAGNELQIGGEPYTVSGVIDDGDRDNRNIYVPVTRLDRAVGVIAANVSEDGLTESHIRSEWRQMSVDEGRYHIVNFDVLRVVAQDKLWLALALAAMGLLFLGMKKTVAAAAGQWRGLDRLRQEVYTVDVLKSAVFRRFPAYISVGLAMLAAAVAIAVDAFGRALRIYNARDMLTGVHTDAFAVQL
ncbi:MAG: ABC transporter permease, partial [Firmicutes bacterium]|nr:ABC transporter permease [Bacillota bacterium]